MTKVATKTLKLNKKVKESAVEMANEVANVAGEEMQEVVAEVAEVKKSRKKVVEEERIELKPIQIERIAITLVGDSSLICHAWSQKAKEMMLDKQMKKASTGREAKSPWNDYIDSLYWVSKRPHGEVTEEDVANATFGFPAIGIKSSAVDACMKGGSIPKTVARGAFHIDGDLIPIVGTPESRDDMVRIGQGTADIRFRGEFKKWELTFTLRYNKMMLSQEQIVNLFDLAGFAVGIGEWRPQKEGSYGMFHVKRGNE